MYFFDIINAAFHSNLTLFIINCIPAAILLALSTACFVIVLRDDRSSGQTNLGRSLLFIFGLFLSLSFLVTLVITLEFPYIDLKSKYAKPIAEKKYREELSDIQKYPNFAFNHLNLWKNRDFRKELLSKIEAGTIIYNKDISHALQPRFLKCMQKQQEAFISTTNEDIDITTINNNLLTYRDNCLTESLQDILDSNAFSNLK